SRVPPRLTPRPTRFPYTTLFRSDMSDGTITITNVGVFGIDTGTPILNPGESAILAFGAIRKQPWVHKNKVRPRWVTQLALSFDQDRKSTRLNSSHVKISYAVFCL